MAAETDLGRFTPVVDLTILAAINRAEWQGPKPYRRGKTRGAPPGVIAAHLGFFYDSATGRALKPRFVSLQKEGQIEMRRHRGSNVWGLTRRGSKHLQAARREQVVEAMAEALPESPQHRDWRHAREEAVSRITDILTATGKAVEDAQSLIVNNVQLAPSEELLDMGERLRREFWRLGSAAYCLREWVEPDESRMDVDEPNRRWLFPRRRTAYWDNERLFD